MQDRWQHIQVISFYLVVSTIIAIIFVPQTTMGQNTVKSQTPSFKNTDTLYVSRMVLAKKIEDRNPLDVTQSFSVRDSLAWCFAEIYNSTDTTSVHFVWYHDSEKHAEVTTNIGVSPSWRTYSSVKLKPGNWRVELVDKQGNKLNEQSFSVE